ncbi:MAG: c-type cytochrome [Paracoccaceae bacterium]
MLKFLKLTAATVLLASPVFADGFGLGRPALPEEIAAWDVDVMPDGRGLPEGGGNALDGEEIFAEVCASCHGDFAEGVDNWPVLAGGFDTLADKDPVKTVGSYWPHLSTVWDYVHRSMPFGSAQTLSDDEVYAIVAYILYSNDMVDEEFELTHENFNDFAMYNTEGFIVDDRGAAEYSKWRAAPCMSNCKDSVEITMRASVIDVTPDEGGDAEMTSEDHAAVEPEEAAVVATLDPELVKSGEAVFKKCKACHQVGEGAKNRSGPQLNGVVGRSFAAVDGFKYSKVFQDAAAEGRIWDDAAMTEFLTKPRAYLKGTKMGFAGLKKPDDITAVIAYLKSFGE